MFCEQCQMEVKPWVTPSQLGWLSECPFCQWAILLPDEQPE